MDKEEDVNVVPSLNAIADQIDNLTQEMHKIRKVITTIGSEWWKTTEEGKKGKYLYP